MTTARMTELYTQVRDRLLTFADPSGATLADILADRLYFQAPKQTDVYPFAVLRLVNQRMSAGENGRTTADAELMLFTRPTADAITLERAADLAQQAMLGYTDNSDGALGIVYSRRQQRDLLPRFGEPADADVVQIRLVFELVAYPRFLMQHLTP